MIAWWIGVAAFLWKAAIHFKDARCYARASSPASRPEILREAADLQVVLGLRRMPALRESTLVSGPVVIGPLHPCVILPAHSEDRFSPPELRMALAHELAHLRRGDLWLAGVPYLTRVLFFFHPLAWLACREWAASAESACDAVALQATEAPVSDYGRLLVKLSVSGRDPRSVAIMGATADYTILKRRLTMLRDLSLPSPKAMKVGLAVLLALVSLGIVPWKLTARSDENPEVSDFPAAALSVGPGSKAMKTLSSNAPSDDRPGKIATVAGRGDYGFSGDGGPAPRAYFFYTSALAIGDDGSLFIGDLNNHRVRVVRPDGIVMTVAGHRQEDIGPALQRSENGGDGGPAVQAELTPSGVAIDRKGNLYISDDYHNSVRKVRPDGVISTIAGSGFIKEVRTQEGRPQIVRRGAYSGDGGPATKAMLNGPKGLAADSQGNLYIADSGNHCVRKIDAKGVIATVAGTGESSFSGDGGPARQARLNRPSGIALDAEGNLFIADEGNNRVRKVSVRGKISTVAGDDPPFGLQEPSGLAVDSAGNLFIGDGSNRVRVLRQDRTVTVVAGTGRAWYSGDGGPALRAELNGPRSLAVDRRGHLFIADMLNHSVRRVNRIAAPGLLAGLPFPSKSGSSQKMASAAYRYALPSDAFFYYDKALQEYRSGQPQAAVAAVHKALTGPLRSKKASQKALSTIREVARRQIAYALTLAKLGQEDPARRLVDEAGDAGGQVLDDFRDRAAVDVGLSIHRAVAKGRLQLRVFSGDAEAAQALKIVESRRLELYDDTAWANGAGILSGFAYMHTDINKTRWGVRLHNMHFETELKNVFAHLPENERLGKAAYRLSNEALGFYVDPALKDIRVSVIVLDKEDALPFPQFLEALARAANLRRKELPGGVRYVERTPGARVIYEDGLYKFLPSLRRAANGKV